jgi:hypothetical protein
MSKLSYHKKDISLTGVIWAGILTSIGILMFQNRAYITLFNIEESQWGFLFRIFMIKYYYVGFSFGLIFAAILILYNSIKWGLPKGLRVPIDSGVASLGKQRRDMQERQYKVTFKSLMIFIILILFFIFLFSSLEILGIASMADFVYDSDTFFKGVETRNR